MQTLDENKLKEKNAENFFRLSHMDADLGLFNQLLQMVDGDWSDSIHGICDHITERFNALGVVLSVFDNSYNQFIYIEYSISEKAELIFKNNEVTVNKEAVLDVIKNAYSTNKSILEYGIFTGKDLYMLADVYFAANKKFTEKILKELELGTVFAIPDIDAHKNFTCSFHIVTSRVDDKGEKKLINEYLTQLNIALEIVFLVRELYLKATHDSLTRLFNHKQGQVLLKREIDRVQRNKQPLTVVMLDIDYFKKINDTYGHQAGDRVLEYMGNLLMESVRQCDIVSRYGGEEFLLVFPDTSKKNAVDVIKRMKDELQEHVFKYGEDNFSVTASFGVEQYNHKKHSDNNTLISAVDKNLYKAKKNGRNKIV